mgnify:CR=1 FL=1
MRTGTLSLLLLAVGSCWAQMPVVPTERTPPTDPAKAEPNETETAAKAEEARKVQAEYGRKKYDELPDFGEADVNKRLRCSACVASVHEIMASLRDLEGTKGKKYTKSYHMVEVLDDVCLDKVGKEYGLLVSHLFRLSPFAFRLSPPHLLHSLLTCSLAHVLSLYTTH